MALVKIEGTLLTLAYDFLIMKGFTWKVDFDVTDVGIVAHQILRKVEKYPNQYKKKPIQFKEGYMVVDESFLTKSFRSTIRS
jgi:hypothetical protein